MEKILFSCFILTTFFFVVYSQNGSNTTLAKTTETNKTISISSNSVRIVVKCRDTNSLLTNINLDNSGSVTMDNNDRFDEKITDTPIILMFDQCHTRTSNNLFSIFKSLSPLTFNNNSQIEFSAVPILSSFHISVGNQAPIKQTSENGTIVIN